MDLFGPDDPLSLDSMLQRQRALLQGVKRQKADQQAGEQPASVPLPPLSADEQNSVLGNVTSSLLGGVGWVGSVLDKYTGGRAARGLLGGHPDELASIIPFSDQLGITNPDRQVSGRDLTNNLGLTSKEDNGLLSTGLGIGADILTNPTTYLSFGGSALTEAGEAASKVGALKELSLAQKLRGFASADEIPAAALANAKAMNVNAADLVGKPLQGLVGVGLPFSKPAAVLGSGDGAAHGVEAVGQGLGYLAQQTPLRHVVEPVQQVLAPIGRYARALFDPSVAGATSAAGQAAGGAYTGGVARSMTDLGTLESSLIRRGKEAGLLEQPGLVRQIAEQSQGSASPLSDAGRAANEGVGQMKDYMDGLGQQKLALGMGAPQLVDDSVDYFPAYKSELAVPSKGMGRSGPALPTADKALSARDAIFKNIPGGRTALNQLSMNPELSGLEARFPPDQIPPALQRAQDIRLSVLNVSPQEEASIPGLMAKAAATPQLTSDDEAMLATARRWQANGTPLTAAQQNLLDRVNAAGDALLTPQEKLLISRVEQSNSLADWAAKLDPQYAGNGDASKATPFFGNHPVQDFTRKAAAEIRSIEAGKAIHGLFRDSALPTAQPGWVPLHQAFGHAGFEYPEVAAKAVADQLGAADPTKLFVPPDAVKDATRFMTGFKAPEAMRGLLGAIDYVTNLTKSFQTSLFPNFHVRNFTSGQFANWMLGAADPRYGQLNPLAWISPVLDAQKLLRGGVIDGAADIPYFAGRGLTDAEATGQLADLAYAHRAVEPPSALGDAAGTPAEKAAALASKIPGLEPFEGFLPAVRRAVPASWQEANPLNIAGVNANADVFAPMKAAREVGDAVDDTNRLSAFVGQLRQGYAPDVAAMRARLAHVDYYNLTDFERQVMRRLVPFYSYSRSIIPFVLQQVAERPGGLGGTAAMAAYEARRQTKDTFVPDYLTSGLALPMGKEQDGTQRFLTKFDTPVENAFGKVGYDWRDTALGLLSELNPIIKAPLEQAVGKQFFTGRDIEDLYPVTGNQVADQVLMNSPLSRFLTVGRTLADERKWADPIALATNLGSGVRLADVDMEKQRDLAAREYINEALKGSPGVGRYETVYARPGSAGQLTPEDVLLLRLDKSLEQKTKQKGKIGVPK